MEMIEELKLYNRKLKAKIVYNKCIKAGKTKWAKNIKIAYGLYERSDDAVDAMAMALALLHLKKYR